jgi:hypothetical protein
MRNNAALHFLQESIGHDLRNDPALPRVHVLVDRADQVWLPAGTHRGVAVGFADVGPHAVDLCVGGVGEEGERVGALADDVAWGIQ